MWYRALVRPVLFRVDPERAHDFVAAMLRRAASMPGACRALDALYGYHSSRLAGTSYGLSFPNPIGLAAGFDKTGELYPALACAGFGFIECGTFTAHRQEGNPRPRVFRFPAERAIVNRMGFNNPGAECAAATLRASARPVPRGVSIGKSRRTELADAARDHRASIELLAPGADYLALNVSSPNTPQLRTLQQPAHLRDLLRDAAAALRAVAPKVPLLLKIAPDDSDEGFAATIATAVDAGVAGLIVANTTTARTAVPSLAGVEGGLSGAPLRDRATSLVAQAFRLTAGRLPLIGVGGIFSGADALEKIRAGATLVQLYTGYVFNGPGLPRSICRHLDRHCRRSGLRLADLVGTGVRP